MEMSRRGFLCVSLPALSTLRLDSVGRYRMRPDAASSPADIFYDRDGLIVHKNLDGGDTAQREGWYWFGTWIREHILKDPWTIARDRTFLEVMRLLEPANDGIFYRHPKLPPWNNPFSKKFGFSRDQMVPVVAAMGIRGTTARVKRLWKALPKDPLGGTRHTFNGDWISVLGQKVIFTGDIVGPMTVNLFKRAWGQKPGLAGVNGETELLANVGLRLRAASLDKDDTGDDLNLIVMLLLAKLRYKSAISERALELYAKNREHSYGSYLKAYRAQYGLDPTVPLAEVRRRMDRGIAGGWEADVSAVYGAVLWYHREEVGANPKLAELYKPIIGEYFKA